MIKSVIILLMSYQFIHLTLEYYQHKTIIKREIKHFESQAFIISHFRIPTVGIVVEQVGQLERYRSLHCLNHFSLSLSLPLFRSFISHCISSSQRMERRVSYGKKTRLRVLSQVVRWPARSCRFTAFHLGGGRERVYLLLRSLEQRRGE
jgi:hypothetical protein